MGVKEMGKAGQMLHTSSYKMNKWNFHDGPVVKNPASNVGDTGSISGQRTKILYATEQLSQCPTTRKALHHNERSHVPQLRPHTAK